MAKPSNLISVAEARELQKNWMSTRAVDIEKGRGHKDAREMLFSLEELQNFLDYIKENSKNANPGVRIYFGAYDRDDNDLATVFLSPTVDAKEGAENDYDLKPLNRGISGWPPKNY